MTSCINMLAALLLAGLTAAQDACLGALEEDWAQSEAYLEGRGGDTAALLALIFDGKSINDLGHYESCLTLERTYVTVQIRGEPHPELYGLCVPVACSVGDIQSLLNQQQGSQGAAYDPQAHLPTDYALGLGGGLVVLLLCLLFCLVLAGSYADFAYTQATQKQQTEIPLETLTKSSHYAPLVDPEVSEQAALPPQMRFLRSFSVLANGKKLLDLGNYDIALTSLDGVKAMTVGWVVLANVYLYRYYGPSINPEDVGEVAAHWTSVLAYSGVFATDTFLWVTAFLVSNGLFVGVTKGKFEVKALILGRVLRFLPLIVFCLLFYSTVMPALGYGPLWHRIDLLTEDCSSYWWSNLFFLNNFVPNWTGNHCLGVGWYLALDVQLLVLLPAFLIVYMKYPNTVCWALWAGCITLGVVITSSVASVDSFKVAYIARENYSHDFLMKVMAKPYCRIVAYLLGAYCAATYFAIKVEETEDLLMRRLMYWLKKTALGAPLCFLLGLGTITFTVFVQRPVYEDWRDGYAGWTDSGNETFLGFEHLLFSLGLSLLLLPVLVGEARWVRRVLAQSFWRPFSRLSLVVVLAQVAVARALFAGEQRCFYWQKAALLKDFVLVLSLSYLFGLFVYFLVQAPAKNLIRAYLKL